MGKKNMDTDKVQQNFDLASTPVHTTQDEAQIYEANDNAIKRAQIADETWDSTVMQLMEEYDEAWTRLADL